ncbi:hypothetical protein L6164_021874 [Bauhinia variegata]|uniref:Uncharacterized protein n=1 Tax=Bauhinia variegata TaxID=167791 RepID=A0ACB9MCZ8_BAUVA|nr:hypothetical protein L6164_021874 [Bauhinia variegata]
MPEMRRQIFLHLLFAICLLLAASPLSHFTANVCAIQSGQLKFRPVRPSSKRIPKHVTPEWVEEMKSHKNPSGPNPTVGN